MGMTRHSLMQDVKTFSAVTAQIGFWTGAAAMVIGGLAPNIPGQTVAKVLSGVSMGAGVLSVASDCYAYGGDGFCVAQAGSTVVGGIMFAAAPPLAQGVFGTLTGGVWFLAQRQ